MPRPVRPIQIMMAVMNPEGIHACTKRGFHIQTTPLSGNHQLLVDQVGAFARAKDEMGEDGAHLTLTLSRVAHMAANPAERRRKIEAAHHYYGRFDNVSTGPGLVDHGMIRELPRSQSAEELGESLLICTTQEMIDKLGPYAELGIDRVILNMNFGLDPQETRDSIQAFAEEVMPHFTGRAVGVAAQ
jgi:alkanesulfonate monooxygenase SsuD/methylene tetrahydromethanopterin reductase-like flavin-dependent oxidoreductase (luciferase family)